MNKSEAIQWTGDNISDVAAFAGDQWMTEIAPNPPGDDLIIDTPTGEMRANPGDWIIRRGNAELVAAAQKDYGTGVVDLRALASERRLRAQIAADIRAQAAAYDDATSTSADLEVAFGLRTAAAIAEGTDRSTVDPNGWARVAELMLLGDDGEPRIKRWTLGTETATQPAFSSMCRRGECDRCDLGSIHRPCEHDCHVIRDGAL